ncbi:unnamed protein product [Ceutorhynchus assimilis]|uniref:Spaetzle domain-containing protein n=1 Tax=Ceutorhynchus assimilis TaxID=467358 RepID=A0A9N9N2N4_9CUCU|nr:unnamed protein product [Ceutorhynchus assimilis]
MKSQSIYFVISVFMCCTLATPIKEPKLLKTKNRFKPKFNPSSCTFSLGICNRTDAYPINAIQRLVKRKKNLQLFSKVSLIEPASDFPLPQVRNTIEPDNLCRTQTVTILPKVGYDLQSGEHRFIINIKDYVQTVVYETCVKPDEECIGADSFPFGFRTLCKQKNNIVRLVSLTSKGNIEYGKFMVPSTCICSYYRDINNELSAF